MVTFCSRNSWSTWVTPSMMTRCIWVSMAWRIARRSSPFSLAWENALLLLLKTPWDEWGWYDSFITRKLFSSLFCSLIPNPLRWIRSLPLSLKILQFENIPLFAAQPQECQIDWFLAVQIG